MDTASRDALVAAVGELSEPFLERAIERYELGLASTHHQLLTAGNSALSALSSEGLVVTGQINDVRLSRLDVGAVAVRLIGTAKGNVSVVVTEQP